MPSTVVNFAHYDADHEILEIGYKNGRKYRYLHVPSIVYEEFKRSGSKGRFLNARIKKYYDYERV